MPKNKDRNGGGKRDNKGVVKSLSRLVRRKQKREDSYKEACRMAGRPLNRVEHGRGPGSIIPAE